MLNEKITILITDDGLYSKWIGAELVSAIDTDNMMVVGYLLRARHTLTCTVMLGRPGNENDKVEIYIEALNEEGRAPVAIFQMSKAMYGTDRKPETDADTLHWLSHMIEENYCQVALQSDEDEQDEIVADNVISLVKPNDKSSN